jgi:hypothetical protein
MRGPAAPQAGQIVFGGVMGIELEVTALDCAQVGLAERGELRDHVAQHVDRGSRLDR